MKKLNLGHIVATPGALEALRDADISSAHLLMRHVSGDWGSVSRSDAKANDAALIHGDRVLSSYVLSTGVTIWIITEADRSATTLLLPEDY